MEFPADLLERMTEHAVANVMHQRGRQSDMRRRVAITKVTSRTYMPLDDTHQLPSDVKDAYAVGKARVSSTRENKFGETELADPP